MFDEVSQNGGLDQALDKKTIKFNRIEKHINRKALDKVDFYRFSNLKQYFPSLKSVDEFLTSDNYLGEVEIEVSGLKERLDALSNHDKYDVALDAFKNLVGKIEASTTEHIGTKEFK